MYQRNVSDQLIEKSSRSETQKPFQHKKSFRLNTGSEDPVEKQQSYLIKYDFKQRIDSMFDETRSAILESENVRRNISFRRTAQSDCGREGPSGIRNLSSAFAKREVNERWEEKKVKNTVQARIEKMFADVSTVDVGEEATTPEVLRFQVDHIGSLPLFSKITSLQGLQEPLKNLYFNYRKNRFPASKLQALLEISSLGLKVQNFGQNKSAIKEQLNPFPSIAVWAALKFVCRSQQPTNKISGNSGLEYAFLPIVLDQNNTEKSTLFQPLDQNDVSCAMEKIYDDHSPLFVVIMRQNGTSNNRLLCHGFACATSEDAIVLAANLYKKLVATMNHNIRGSNNDNDSVKRRKKVKCRNGLGTVCSVAGSSICGEGESDYVLPEKKGENIPKKVNKPRHQKKMAPPRPERKNEVTKQDVQNGIVSDNCLSKITLDSDEIVALEDYTLSQEISRLSNTVTPEKIKPVRNEESSFRRGENERRFKNGTVCSWRSSTSDKVESGDILTKVVIPRSGSFLNASGPLTSRYGRFVSDRGTGINANCRKNSIHSPLGFIELFNELRVHEGLNNIDEILNTIIDVDGMSFNSLKPIYKEFIVKLAVTLTKDELYQRSKSIMQKQKRRKRQLAYNRRRRNFVSGYRIKRAFHISVSKLKSSSRCKISLPFSSYIFPTMKKMQQSKPQFKNKIKLRRRQNGPSSTLSLTSKESFESLLGFNGNRSPTEFDLGLRSDIYRGEVSFHRKKLLTGTCTRVQNMTMTFHPVEFSKISASPNLCRKRNEKSPVRRDNQRENVSGYVSCSDCSYNSESCKYRSSKKCYCSMGKHRLKMNCGPREGKENTLEGIKQSSVSSCSCDTDSCIESEKCYCDPAKKPSIFEQLRRQGFAASESSLSRPSSPTTADKLNENQTMYGKKGKTCLQASKSLEFFHVQKNESRFHIKYDENCTEPIEMRRKIHDERFPSSVNPSNSRKLLANDKNINLRSGLITNTSVPVDEGSVTDDDINQENNVNNRSFQNSDDHFNYNYDDHSYNRSGNDSDNYYGKHFAPNSPGSFPSVRHQDDVREQNKILVVSARDQKGQVKNSVTPLYNKDLFSSSNFPLKFLKNENIHETDALSIKKTAEIAALFSDMKVEKKNHINIKCNRDIIYNSLDPSDGFLKNKSSKKVFPIKNINLENSLGYFP